MTKFDSWATPFPSEPRSFSSTANGSGASGTVADFFNPDPFGLRDDANNDVVESLEFMESEDERGLKPGLWTADAGPRWLGLLGAGEYDMLALRDGDPGQMLVVKRPELVPIFAD